MSWHERDYNWRERNASGAVDWRAFLPPPMTLKLLLAHLAGFIVASFAVGGTRYSNGGPLALRAEFHTWAVLTHPIATQSGGVFWIMMAVIWMLAAPIEARLGARTMLGRYGVASLFSGLAYIAIAAISPSLAAMPLDFPLGAIVAWSLIYWRRLAHEQAMFLKWPFSISSAALWLLGLACLAALMVFRTGAAAWMAAGLTGGILSLVLEFRAEAVDSEDPDLATVKRPRVKRKLRAQPPKKADPVQHAEDAELDAILTKISREGLNSLTPAEWKELERARQARRGSSRHT
ncbi:MAG: hypothetical protein HZB38_18085 [Planctomycetes bacterium]|nr:hypothetical protein [Planctomycetota bacterium]